MNQIFSTKDGLCLGFTDDDFPEKMLVLKYNQEVGKLGIALMNGDNVLGKFTLDPSMCQTIADYFDSMSVYHRHSHLESEK